MNSLIHRYLSLSLSLSSGKSSPESHRSGSPFCTHSHSEPPFKLFFAKKKEAALQEVSRLTVRDVHLHSNHHSLWAHQVDLLHHKESCHCSPQNEKAQQRLQGWRPHSTSIQQLLQYLGLCTFFCFRQSIFSEPNLL